MEQWKVVEGYNDRYEISSFGRVRNKKGKILNGGIHTEGYHCVQLTSEFGAKFVRVHRLVAMYFIPNPDNKPCVNHKDGNKLNNCVDNLEWVSYSENNKHAYDNNLKIGNGKRILCVNNNTIYKSCSEAGRQLGLDNRRICDVLNGKLLDIQGYKFIRIE